MVKKEYKVQGVHCDHCVQTILEVTNEIKGIDEITILPDGVMSLDVTEDFKLEELKEVLGEEGFSIQN